MSSKLKHLLAPFVAVLALVLLTGCGEDPDPAADPSSRSGTGTGSEADPVHEDTDLGLGLPAADVPLEVGDCWGLKDEIQLDPIPCEGRHIYEVVGIVDDWPHEQYAGSLEAGIEGDEAMMALCDRLTDDYFGYDAGAEGIMTDHGEPKYGGRPEVVVCSAHTGPGVDMVRDEVEGSFADRGLR